MRNPVIDPDNRFVPASVQQSVIKAIARAHEEVALARKDEFVRKSKSYIKMLVNDAKDLREVFALCKRGKWSEASRKASSMDTAARENIPWALYELIDNRPSGKNQYLNGRDW